MFPSSSDAASEISRRQLFRAAPLLVAGAGLGLTKRVPGGEQAAQTERGARITSVQTFVLRHELKRPFGVSVSNPLDRFRDMLVVRIETDSGHVGWGETSPINGARATIDESIGPMLKGQNPLNYRALWRRMWGANFGNALAVGAVDMALNDLRGKILNLSVAELFGGRLRDRIRVYASTMNYVDGTEPEDHYPQDAAEKLKLGFRAMKMRLGRYSVAREKKIVEAVRGVVGPDVLLMTDGNGGYTMESAVRMGHVLKEFDFECFEEPLPQSPKYAGYEELRRRLPLSLAGGEALDSRGSAKELIDRRTFDIIQPDISLCGGFGEVLFIAEMAALSGIRCIPHCWGSDILIAATAQLVSLLPDPHWGLPTDSPLLELDQSENPWRNGLSPGLFKVTEGQIDVPRGPGLGIQVDEKMIQEYSAG